MNTDMQTNLPKIAAQALDFLGPAPSPSQEVSQMTNLPPLREVFTEQELVPVIIKPPPPTAHAPLDVSSRRLPQPEPLPADHLPPWRRAPGPRDGPTPPRHPHARSRLPGGRPRARHHAPGGTRPPARPAGAGAGAGGGLDLSLDENRHVRPRFSPAKLAAQAILRSRAGRLSTAGILAWLAARYAFARHAPRRNNCWAYRVPAELRRMAWVFERVAGPGGDGGPGAQEEEEEEEEEEVWQVRAECRARMLVEAFREGKLPSQLRLLGKDCK